ncbi:MAG: ethanolamine ammonia-lyase light chain EutC, partial [Burkholderiaceae bacterium]
MTESKRQSIVVNNPWQLLRKFTPGRIALGRTGVSLPTQQQLAFQLDHARARDAVHHDLNGDGLAASVNDLRLFEPCVVV